MKLKKVSETIYPGENSWVVFNFSFIQAVLECCMHNFWPNKIKSPLRVCHDIDNSFEMYHPSYVLY